MSRLLLIRGTGSIGMRHFEVAQGIVHLQPIAWPVRSERSRDLRAAGHAATDSLPATPDGPAAAIVATDTGRHHTDALFLLEAGWDLLVEKPLTVDLPSAVHLATVATTLGRRLYVACPLRFDAGLLTFRQHLPAIGPVHAVRIECQSYLPDWRPDRDYRQSYAARRDEGGVLRDLIHEIDYAIWLFGPPKEVFAHLQDGTRLGIAAESGADLLWQTAGDTSVSLRLDYLSRGYRRIMRAFGAAGEIVWDAGAGMVRLDVADQPEQTWTVAPDRNRRMHDQLMAFLAATAGDPPSHLATMSDGIQAIAVCEAARLAARTGQRAAVPEGAPS